MTVTIDIVEVCDLLKCSEQTLVAALRTGELPGVKFGRDWVIPRDAFYARINAMAMDEAVERRRQPSTPLVERATRSRRAPLVAVIECP